MTIELAQPNRRTRLQYLAIRCGWILVAILGEGCGNGNRRSQTPLPIVEVSPAQIHAAVDLGVVENGGRGRGSEVVRVVNESDRELAIDKWVTSCECVSILPDACLIGPRAEQLFKISAEESNPDFVGNLEVEVNGLSGSGDCIVKVIVRVSVVKSLPEWK